MSEWKQAAAVRRDFRATKQDAVPRQRSNKPTRRWCKGKVGREHEWKVIQPLPGLSSWHRRYVCDCCKVCGKRVRYRFDDGLPFPWSTKS